MRKFALILLIFGVGAAQEIGGQHMRDRLRRIEGTRETAQFLVPDPLERRLRDAVLAGALQLAVERAAQQRRIVGLAAEQPEREGRVGGVAGEETLVDQVYSAAGVDFHFRDPLWYDSTAARDGQINLDTIQANAVRAGLIDLEPGGTD